MSEVARRHDLTRQQIYQWRRDLRRKGLWPQEPPAVFLPVAMVDRAWCDGDGEPPGPGGIQRGGGPVDDEAPGVSIPAAADRGGAFHPVEIVLRNGRVVRATVDVPDAVLTRVIRIAEAS